MDVDWCDDTWEGGYYYWDGTEEYGPNLDVLLLELGEDALVAGDEGEQSGAYREPVSLVIRRGRSDRKEGRSLIESSKAHKASKEVTLRTHRKGR